MSNLPEQVEKSIFARRLFKRGERILVAVSGGVDSMTLLHLLHALSTKHRWRLTVAHFNHQLRGRASAADERFVKNAAIKLGLKPIAGRGDVKTFAQKHGLSIEMAARELRHSFLAQSARCLKIASIALAHHADDQVELFFLRLLRGSGGEGLAGMKWHSPSPADAGIQLARPLLNINKADLELFAQQNNLRSREDASNASMDVLRNRIRHELLPLLKSRYQPALAVTSLRVMEIVGAESSFTSATAEQWLKRRNAAFSKLPIAVQRHVLRLQLMRLGLAADFDLIEQLRENPSRTVSTHAAVSVSRTIAGLIQTRATIRATFDTQRLEVSLQARAGRVTIGGVRCHWKIVPQKLGIIPKPTVGRECFDADKVGTRIVLRHWRAGDRFQPIGMASSVKIQDWFTNQKVPRTHRHKLLVAESDSGEIFWVEGQRIADSFKLTNRTVHRLVWHWLRH